MPVAVVSLVDRDRVWFKSNIGYPVKEIPRNCGYCSYVILEDTPELIVVSDVTDDDRFNRDKAVRFFAGVSDSVL